MITVNVDEAIRKIKRDFSNLDSDKTNLAIMNAINRTLIKGRTTARKEVKGIYNIPQKNMGGIDKVNAKKSLLIGYITASTQPIPMDAFAPKFENAAGSISISKRGVQKTKDFKKSKISAAVGVSIEVLKGKRIVVPYAFMIRGAKPRVFARGMYKGGGNWGFMQRNKRVNSTGNDTPIKPLVSVTVHAAVINDKAMNNIANDIEAYYPARLEQELRYQLNKMSS